MVAKIKSNIFSDLRTRTLIGFLPDNDVRWQKDKMKNKIDSPESGSSPAQVFNQVGLIFNK